MGLLDSFYCSLFFCVLTLFKQTFVAPAISQASGANATTTGLQENSWPKEFLGKDVVYICIDSYCAQVLFNGLVVHVLDLERLDSARPTLPQCRGMPGR